MFRPSSLDEALAVLAAHPEALLLAGGTDVMIDINLNHARPETVISLRRVPELLVQTGQFIGSGVTYARLADSPHVALAQASRTVGSQQIRVRGTIGGNLGTASPAGDALPFLVAAEAVVVLMSADATRRVPIGDFLMGPKQNALLPGEL
ncbi:MAG: FAD binding domain-containing protein, partial [Actinomycetota bacterium]|nr:FAD binding domain-containing protein [Actinomycetota bacterium]